MYAELSKLHFNRLHYDELVKNMRACTDAKMDDILARKRSVQAEKNNKQRQIDALAESNIPNLARMRRNRPRIASNSKSMQGKLKYLN